MDNIFTTADHNDVNPNLRNIMMINSPQDEDTEDYDLDYDPNTLYYELQAAASFL